MTAHHLIKSSNLNDVCPYCKTEFKSQESEKIHHLNWDYNVIKCDCGKEILVDENSLDGRIKHFETKELM
ncbi:hypothetical protein HN587_01390 [Candidatus Woesearchaeota archaeon]|jgi:hypothetical protein|nr:hypothetical protein [Candidatus Woesearchaeota archaeon]